MKSCEPVLDPCDCYVVGMLPDEPCVPKNEDTVMAHCTRVTVPGEFLECPDPSVCMSDDKDDGKKKIVGEGLLEKVVKIGKDECL